jgi:hypothetical protein
MWRKGSTKGYRRAAMVQKLEHRDETLRQEALLRHIRDNNGQPPLCVELGPDGLACNAQVHVRCPCRGTCRIWVCTQHRNIVHAAPVAAGSTTQNTKRKKPVSPETTAKRRKREQTMQAFFAPTPLTRIIPPLEPTPQYQCHYCELKFLSPQGLGSHENAHSSADKEAPRKALASGQVKMLEEPVQLREYVSPFEADKTVKERKAATAAKRAVVSAAEAAKNRAAFLNVLSAALFDEEKAGPDVAPQTQARGQDNTIQEKLHILDYYWGRHDGVTNLAPPHQTRSKKATVKWAAQFYSRKFQKRQLVGYLFKEAAYRAAPGRKDRTKRTTGTAALYPDMDTALAAWVRETRSIGIVVETYMLAEEGALIMQKQHPGVKFTFSSGWLEGFLARNNFAVRRVTNNAAKNLDRVEVVGAILNFHLDTRALQASAVRDPVFGYAPPEAVFNRDQIPICCAAGYSRTVDDQGKEVIFDSIKSDKDEKRLATLDLHLPMRALPDRSNCRKPHIVFKASAFCKGSDWTGSDKAGEPKERDLWDPRVLVSFQEHAWVDSATNIHGLSEMEELAEALELLGFSPVQFEDNLSAHLTAEVKQAWGQYLPRWLQRLYPPKLTWCLQVVDRHIGKQYKVTIAHTQCMMKRVEMTDLIELSVSDRCLSRDPIRNHAALEGMRGWQSSNPPDIAREAHPHH